jgi:hypothetical protein
MNRLNKHNKMIIMHPLAFPALAISGRLRRSPLFKILPHASFGVWLFQNEAGLSTRPVRRPSKKFHGRLFLARGIRAWMPKASAACISFLKAPRPDPPKSMAAKLEDGSRKEGMFQGGPIGAPFRERPPAGSAGHPPGQAHHSFPRLPDNSLHFK